MTSLLDGPADLDVLEAPDLDHLADDPGQHVPEDEERTVSAVTLALAVVSAAGREVAEGDPRRSAVTDRRELLERRVAGHLVGVRAELGDRIDDRLLDCLLGCCCGHWVVSFQAVRPPSTVKVVPVT